MRKFTIGGLAVLLLLAGSLSAQTRTGNIFGKAVDDQGMPLPGVTVTLTGSLTAPVTTVSSVEGLFRFISLSPARDYTLKLELDGFKLLTRSDIIVNAGVNVELTLVMEPGAITEEITVVATTPVVDSKKTQVGLNVTREILQSLPSARDPWDIINMAPSVVLTMDNVGGIDGGQQPGFSSGGAAGTDNYWTMDGMTVTETAALGASFGYYDYDVFEEMNITVGGGDVTQQTGGVQVNMVTRRGGNNLSFAGRFYLVDPWFQADTMSDELAEEGVAGVDRFREFRDFGFNIGLPILKDKIWFWGSYGVQDIETITAYGNNDDTLLSTLSGKLNLQIVPQNRLEIFAQGNRKQKYGRDQADDNPQGMIQRAEYHFGFPIIKIQDEHMFGDNLFVSVKWGFYDGGFGIVPVMDPDLENLATWDFEDQRWYGSIVPYIVKKPAYQTHVLVDYFNDNLLGASHDIKFGFEISDRDQATTDWREPGNVILYQNYIDPVVDFDGDGLPDIPASSDFKRFEFYRGYHRLSGSTGQSVFFSDTIDFGRFNVILGLRYDRQHPRISPFTITAVEPDHPVWQNYFTGQTTQLLDGLLPGFQIPERDGIDINGDKYYWEDWSPRVALTMDVFGDGKTVAKLSFGRYGSYMGIGEADRYMPGGGSGWMDFWWQDSGDGVVDSSELYWHRLSDYGLYPVFNASGQFVGDWADAAGEMWGGFDNQNPGRLIEPYQQVNPDAQGGKKTELVASLEREILPDFAVGVTATYNRFDNARWALDYWPDSDLVENLGMWIEWGTPPANIPGLGDTKEAKNHVYYYKSEQGTTYTPYTIVSKQPDYHVNYYGLDFTANKRLSNKWMLNAAFTLSKLSRSYGDEGYMDPDGNMNPNNIWAFEGTANTNYTPRWILKLSGLYQAPFGINLSFTYKGRDGWIIPEYFDLVDYNIPNPRDRSHRIYMTEVGSEHLGTYHNLSLRLEKVLPIGDLGKIYLMADVFNALNLATRERRRDRYHGTYYIYPDASQNTFVPYLWDYQLTNIMNPRVLRLGVRFEF